MKRVKKIFWGNFGAHNVIIAVLFQQAVLLQRIQYFKILADVFPSYSKAERQTKSYLVPFEFLAPILEVGFLPRPSAFEEESLEVLHEPDTHILDEKQDEQLTIKIRI